MKTVHDYETLGAIQNIENSEVPLLETLSGPAIVSWYSQIEDYLQRNLDDQEAARNHENADRLRAFLNTWRENEITGSVNIDELKPLKAAAQQQAAVKSPLRSIFTSLLRNLRKLVADEEALPRGVDTDAIDPMSAGLGRGAPPMSPDFGPEEGMPGELGMPGGEEGLPGEAGAGLEEPPLEGEDADKVITAADTELPGAKKPRR